jgi:NADPH:quinone reductase-like Zn-dependent oxidoreductase
MKAIIYERYGSPDVLELREVDKPTPNDDQLLVKVRAVAVNAADWHLMRADPFLVRLMEGFFKPKHQILGLDIAGEVEAVGRNVTEFKPGDAVFGESGRGGFAEYTCVRQSGLLLKPDNLSFVEAAAIPVSALTALQGLRRGGIKPGQKVLVNGASGGVGTFAVQIAKAVGAEVTAVCSTSKMELARSLGADHVIDYTRENFTKNGRQYDLILAVNGYHPLWAYKRALAPGGSYMMAGGSNAQLFQGMALTPLFSLGGDKKMGNMLAKVDKEDLAFIVELTQTGQVKPIIDTVYKSLEAIPDAIRHIERGGVKGKIVVEI